MRSLSLVLLILATFWGKLSKLQKSKLRMQPKEQKREKKRKRNAIQQFCYGEIEQLHDARGAYI